MYTLINKRQSEQQRTFIETRCRPNVT